MGDRPASRPDRMREVTRRAHAGQTRNGGRLPYWVHTDAVADICDQALRLTGELTGDEAEDLVLAAYGHDLYEDTTVSAAAIREEFGTRVDGWIDGMTNRTGDRDRADYLRDLAAADDEVRVIKCADLVDNTLSVAYGLHDLGLEWAAQFFLPIAVETRAVLLSTPFGRLSNTGNYLTVLVDWAWHRLTASMGTAAAVAATQATTAEGAGENPDRSEKPDLSHLSPAAREMVERLSFTSEEWAESRARVGAEERRRAKELFGDQRPFPIPYTPIDS